MRYYLILLLSFSPCTFSAGFDCKRASNDIEKMICSNDEMNEMDSQLNNLYKIAIHNTRSKETMLLEQRTWLNQKRNKCKDEVCLKNEYSNRLGALLDYSLINAIDKEISLEDVYKKLNMRSFYSSYGPRLGYYCQSYLFEYFDPENVEYTKEWMHLTSGDDVWSISIIKKNKVRISNTITSGTYRSSADYGVVFDNITNDWRALEANIDTPPDCKQYSL